MALANPRCLRSRLSFPAAVVLCLLLRSAGVQADQGCGPEHPNDIRQVMTARNPHVADDAPDSESALRFNRALLVRDFLRLRAERISDVPEAIRRIDPAELRRAGDGGRESAETCGVVRFMREYYAQPDHDYLRHEDTLVPVRDTLPEVSAMPIPDPPRPRPARSALAPEPVPASAIPFGPTAPSAQPQSQLAPPSTLQVDDSVRLAALGLITDVAAQLEVPPFLSFREERIQASSRSEEEVRRRRDAALQATQRIASVLSTLHTTPPLRDAVQSLLGTEGRARLEAGIVRSFQNVPDAAARERVLQMWGELEAAATVKR